jgi:hypothetical protein
MFKEVLNVIINGRGCACMYVMFCVMYVCISQTLIEKEASDLSECYVVFTV